MFGSRLPLHHKHGSIASIPIRALPRGPAASWLLCVHGLSRGLGQEGTRFKLHLLGYCTVFWLEPGLRPGDSELIVTDVSEGWKCLRAGTELEALLSKAAFHVGAATQPNTLQENCSLS